ncbi:uncharacterized protein LOC134660082 [Cydia amplana]|uniref:uncharacterized protein LOC134660082 n=1 Tax=Cydia amplana TaxID=1869771 RepID=UPI002FE5E628
MTENNRKRCRKSKLVPRECVDYVEDESVLQQPAQKKLLLEKIKKEPEDYIPHEHNPSTHKFSVEVEIEGMDTAAPDEDAPDYMKYLFSLSKESEDTAENTQNLDFADNSLLLEQKLTVPVTEEEKTCVVDVKKLQKMLVILHRKYPKELEVVMHCRNQWGRAFHEKSPMEFKKAPKEILLQDVLCRWKQWTVVTRARESPYCYKCYICDNGWWTYTDFVTHLSQHTTYKLQIQTRNLECDIVAYEGDTPGVKDVEIHGKCTKCAKTYNHHLTNKRATDVYYYCNYCDERFQTCRTLTKHEGGCPRNPIRVLAISRAGKEYSFSDFSCEVCKTLFLSNPDLEEHMIICHKVRSDEPIVTVFKTCKDCEQNYSNFYFHVCLKKNFVTECKHCFRKFQNKQMLEHHYKMWDKIVQCRLCDKYLVKSCMAAEHYALHSEQFLLVHRCLVCKKIKVFASDEAMRNHVTKYHKRFDARRPKTDKIIIPTIMLQQCMVDKSKLLARGEALRYHGVPHYLRRVIQQYLTGRVVLYEQRGVRGARAMVCGVPQGSVLGPLLWNLGYDWVIRGSQLPRMVTVCYADDTLVAVRGKQLEEVLRRAAVATELTVHRIGLLGLRVALPKTEAMVLGRMRAWGQLPAGTAVRVGGEAVQVKAHIKYLGLVLDRRWSFEEHFARLAPRLVGAASALGRLLPNLGGPNAPCRRLYAGIVRSMALYGAPIWAGRLTGRARALLRRPQRVLAQRMVRAYRTTSHAAACLLAGTPPWELDAGVLADRYRLRAEARRRGELPDAEEAERVMRGAAERLRERWREALEDSHYGTRTIGAILPIMDEWVDRGKGALTYRVTQVVSGHGCFGHYLHKIQREPGPQCHECGAADDTAQHTLEECNRWAVERAFLRAATGVADLSLHSIIAAMLGSERKWEAVASFCEEVMSQKEEAEREREAAADALPLRHTPKPVLKSTTAKSTSKEGFKLTRGETVSHVRVYVPVHKNKPHKTDDDESQLTNTTIAHDDTITMRPDAEPTDITPVRIKQEKDETVNIPPLVPINITVPLPEKLTGISEKAIKVEKMDIEEEKITEVAPGAQNPVSKEKDFNKDKEVNKEKDDRKDMNNIMAELTEFLDIKPDIVKEEKLSDDEAAQATKELTNLLQMSNTDTDISKVFKASSAFAEEITDNSEHSTVFQISKTVLESVKQEKDVAHEGEDPIAVSPNTSSQSVSETSDLSSLNLEPEVILKAGYRKRKIYKCNKCDFSGFHREYKEHTNNHCSKPIAQEFISDVYYNCTKCDRGFATLKKYALHFEKHGYRYMSCPQCGQNFESLTKLMPHLNGHLKAQFFKLQLIKSCEDIDNCKVYECKNCKETVDQEKWFEHWERHLKLLEPAGKAPQENIKVGENGERSLNASSLKEVLETLTKQYTNENRRAKACIVCSRVFERKNDTKRHLVEHLLEDAYANILTNQMLKCQICGDLHKKPDNYKKHMRDHANLPIYKCGLCNKTFSDSSNFTKHKKIHNLKAYICDICSKKFQAKASLEKHIQMHMETDPITCDQCQRVFYDRSFYKRHYRQHHDKILTKFRCMLCREKFASLREKWDHLWYIHKQRKEKADCPICGVSYRKFNDVKKHALQIHGKSITLSSLWSLLSKIKGTEDLQRMQDKGEGSKSGVKEEVASSDDDCLLIEEEHETLVVYD